MFSIVRNNGTLLGGFMTKVGGISSTSLLPEFMERPFLLTTPVSSPQECRNFTCLAPRQRNSAERNQIFEHQTNHVEFRRLAHTVGK